MSEMIRYDLRLDVGPLRAWVTNNLSNLPMNVLASCLQETFISNLLNQSVLEDV